MTGRQRESGMTSQRARDRLVRALKKRGVRSRKVLEAIRTTPRHLFVDEALASRAYEDTALPIGHKQTISQPYIVARMIEEILPGDGARMERILEIGTGCGYQSVLLAHFARQVYTMDRIGTLVARARERFYALKCNNIRAIHADGNQGWASHAPYEAIVVSASPGKVPELLLEQLSVHGRLVIPVGESDEQRLVRILRTEQDYHEVFLNHVRFVPMRSGLQH